MKLFKRENIVGIFRGFSEGGLEFHADLIFRYRNEFQRIPMHGQFVLVQLETEDEAALGRITSIASEGRLASGSGEDYGLRAVEEDRQIPEDLRDQYLKYRVNIRTLGVVRLVNGKLVFAASHRRLPHVGSRVAFLSDEVLREVSGHNIDGAELGFLALGEFIYSGDDNRLEPQPWMQLRTPAIIPRFEVRHLVSRRSFAFARAGFGKSNLVKLLFSNLYRTTPTVEKRGGRQVPVGTVVFDPDGEYFWPDDKNRPGLCDVPHLEDKIVVFTRKAGPSPFYQSFVASDIKLDIRRLRPADVISIALSPEKQDQQNVRKLKGLNDEDWWTLVDEIHGNGNAADGDLIRRVLRLDAHQDAEMVAARANMTTIVRMLHDPSSQMMDMLLYALREGKLCVVDVSQMRGAPALVLSGLILRRIFDHNQDEFTKAFPETIPTIAVVEEAQAVLGSSGTSGEDPYVAWVKEGRKYDLGAVLVTQQPGSISTEILSQGDNWFVFHLLSAHDLQALKKANAHFSDDLLSALLNEPIEGNGVFWSSAGGKSYPVSTRVLSFERLYKARDSEYKLSVARTFAQELQGRFAEAIIEVHAMVGDGNQSPVRGEASVGEEPDEPTDILEKYTAIALNGFKTDTATLDRIRKTGLPWRGVQQSLFEVLPGVLGSQERDKLAYRLVPRAMSETFGKDKWETEKRPSKSGSGMTTWVVLKK
ncbi:MAG: ATP-binding protein [Acidobacteria bacterium]|nr:ATP-binding protein [Acidobacteriota bacterium]